MEPFAIIEDVFSAVPLSHYRKYIISTLKAASSDHYWKEEDPGSLLYFRKKIGDLMDAAQQLNVKTRDKKAIKQKALVKPGAPDQEIIDPRLYMYSQIKHTQWEAFPRSLSKKEFVDPYLVFKRFFRNRSLKKWHRDLEEMIFYALSPHDCVEDLLDLDLLRINQLLQKLVEAAHLIWVREINPG